MRTDFKLGFATLMGQLLAVGEDVVGSVRVIKLNEPASRTEETGNEAA
jgi:hypothetical protein